MTIANATRAEDYYALLTTGSFSPVLVIPRGEWPSPSPKKPTLDEQCEAAMARLTAHINASCAQHSVAIKADYDFQARRRHQRHVEETCEDIHRRMSDLLCSPYTISLEDAHINGFGILLAQAGLGTVKYTRADPRSVWK